MINLLIYCDIRLYREGLQLVLGKEPDIKLIGSYEDKVQILAQIRSLQSAVVLIDARMQDALVTIREISSLGPTIKVIALNISESNTPNEVLVYVEAGAASYVTCNVALSDLLQAIRATENGELHCSPKVAGALVQHVCKLVQDQGNGSTPHHLTKRELRVLDEIEHGLSNKDIARDLGIGIATVKNHVHHILEKLGVRRRGEAVAVARRLRQAGYDEISVS